MFRAKRLATFLAVILIVPITVIGQDYALKSPVDEKSYLQERGEIIFRFIYDGHISYDSLTRRLSIDKVAGDTITAYANARAFQWFKNLTIPYQVLTPPSLYPEIFTSKRFVAYDWHTQYPSYAEYIALMNQFAAQFPDICHLTEFGTTPGGHKLLALKLSDHPAENESEPVFFYTSSMHGDELLGYNLMLRLIEDLLTGYDSDDHIRRLLDHVEIWINPIANPDGAYYISDLSVAGAVRYNSHHVDLNRDFPDVTAPKSVNDEREPENLAMMHFMDSIKPVLCANFHGGAEVVNYPWDSWDSLHADDVWYRYISRKYADTVHQSGPTGYMTFQDNGITNGSEWYTVYGGRQDYNNFFLHGREVTIELSDNKIPPEDELQNYWMYNRKSMIQYMDNVFTSIQGVITDSVTGKPLSAQIIMLNHDKKNSFVYSDAVTGNFIRLNVAGTYHLAVICPGYRTKYIAVTILEGETTKLEVKLAQQPGFGLNPNPFTDYFSFYIPDSGGDLQISVFDMTGRLVKLTKTNALGGRIYISTKDMAPGSYVVQISMNNDTWKFHVIKNP